MPRMIPSALTNSDTTTSAPKLRQSRRNDLYQEHIEKLLAEGKAYPCYCSKEELEAYRKEALKQGRSPKYSGKCREGAQPLPGREPAIRYKAPHAGTTEMIDLIRGPISFENSQLDDLIIRRSFGTPTYNLCVVVDDALMGMTHVIRGDDHINNTPKQILLYQALGYSPPEFAHMPLTHGPDGSKLSKRKEDEYRQLGISVSVQEYRHMGYLPHALVNYLARLGWSHGDQEIFSRDELKQKFDLEHVGKSAGVMNPKKLKWLNAHYIKESDPSKIAQQLVPCLRQRGVEADLDERLTKVVRALQPRAKTLMEMAEMAEFYFKDDFSYDEKGGRKFLRPELSPFLVSLLEELRGGQDFVEANLEKLFRQLTVQKGLKLNQAAQGVRVALTGKTTSPGLFEVMEGIGRERVIKRLERALGYIGSRHERELAQ